MLDLGKKYLDRHGHCWHVIRKDEGYRYPFIAVSKDRDGNIHTQSFTEEGRWSNHLAWPFDLIREA